MKTGDFKETLNTYTVEEGYLPCDGSIYDIADYPQLFPLLYNIDPAYQVSLTQFKTPDLTSKVLLGGNAGLEVGSNVIKFDHLPLTNTGVGQVYTGVETALMVNDYQGNQYHLSSLNTPIQIPYTPLGCGTNVYIKW